jgi:hypothetical protein
VLTENDIFFLRDYYYSAGQDLVFKHLLSAKSASYKFIKKSDSSKVILTYKGGVKIFTPREINQTAISMMDRPYAGYEYLSFGITRFDVDNRGFFLSVDLGLVGRYTGLGQFQKWWHKLLDYRTPSGWHEQIANELTLNFNYNHWKSWKVTNCFDVVNISSITAGTCSNRLSEDLVFRFLNFKALKNSNFTGSILSYKSKGTSEFFIFGGIGVDVVASNIFIEGSLFNKGASPFVLNAIPFIFKQQLGIMCSTHKWSYSFTGHHLSKEVMGGIDHFYGSLDIGFRF